MENQRHSTWLRIGLGVLAALILLTTLPAYMNPTSNPGLASLAGESATLGSVAGLFLGRQLTIALIAVYGAIKGTTQPLLIGAFGIAFFNFHDAIFVSAFAGVKPGAIIGLVIALLGFGIMWMVHRQANHLQTTT